MQRRPTSKDSGFVLVWMATMLTVLVGLAGFCVDLGNWYLTISRLQNAADAASLAGAPFLPEHPDLAKQAALDSLVQNGFKDSADVLAIEQVAGRPARLRVKLAATANSAFLGLISEHMSSQRFSRTGVSEMRGAMPMGSPSNVLGQEPPGFTSWNNIVGSQRDYWLQTTGGKDSKVDGDRWNAGTCEDPYNDEANAGSIYGCTGDQKNKEHMPDGQEYFVRIPKTTTGRVVIQVFDAPLVDTEDDEDDYYCTGHNIGAIAGLELPGDPPGLYAAGDSSPYCTQDYADDNKPVPDAAFTVLSPRDSPDAGAAIAGCDHNFRGFGGDVEQLLTATPSGYEATAAGYRHWYTLCEISVGAGDVPGDYRIKVKPSVDRVGVNSYSLRAAVIKADGSIDTIETTGINVFAAGKLVIAANSTGAAIAPEFYLVKLLSNQAGETLNVNLYDIGDSDYSSTLTIMPPPDATSGGVPMTSFPSCVVEGPLPTRNTKTTMPGCKVPNLNYDDYNGQLVKFTVVIPPDYKCNDADPAGCWIRVKTAYPAGAFTEDTTSWEIATGNNPLRLLPDS